jgi:hypothetical protein
MIERATTIAPAITRTRKLSIEQLKNLELPLIFQEDAIVNRKEPKRLETTKSNKHKVRKSATSPRNRLSRIHHKVLS